MTSFDLGAFEAAVPPTGTIPGTGTNYNPYGAGAPTSAPGVDQHITVLNMSGKRATGLWTTEQERSHFTIEPGHILNIHRSGVSPVRTIEISTGGAQPVYSNTRVMPGSTIAIVLNEDGGYSPLAPIDGGGGSGSDNNARRAAGTSTAGYGASYGAPTSNGGGYVPPSNGGNNGGGYAPPSNGNGYGATFAGPSNSGGYAPPSNRGGGGGPLGAAYRALTNGGALSYSPFGWRV
ncbi:hypothetical protein pclt_cds_120 [Pandoravirus celtis]|uniref:Uncharacterized protein n=1 Tax=Pandoravirus celtis TaxID=2568002 RepID=A0A4D6EGP0_9VIRU|nr:hypothetical protein pclt_cds_120 [Pandoravirus celtis]